MSDLQPEWFVFLLSVLAVFRLATMFSKESGPGRIFAKLRRSPPPKSSAREGLSCPYCVGMWFAVMVTAFVVWRGVVPLVWSPIYCLAIAAGAFICNVLFAKDV